MNKRTKRFDRILGLEQKYYTFADVRNFLGYYGFEAERKSSSHFVFRREETTHIVIVVHHNLVKRIYVKDAIRNLKNYSILP